MSLFARELSEVWDALRASKAQRNDYLTETQIRKLRGIWDLRFEFEYPVTVLAGPNGSGKSTVLFACACAYREPNQSPRKLTPGKLFPNFVTKQQDVSSDARQLSEITFHYIHDNNRFPMSWKRGRNWNRSFTGGTGKTQPERHVYLRTLANLTNPSEVRSILQLSRKEVATESLTARGKSPPSELWG